MQSRLKLIGLATAAALALIVPTGAALAASDGIVLRSGTLRAGPGTDFPSVDQFSRGEEIQIYGCTVDYNWCDVSNDDNRGWFPGSRIGYLEGGRRVVITEAGPSLGIAILGFSVGTYWGQHYYNRPFYNRWHRYEDFDRYGPPRGPRPDWNNGPRPQPGWDNRPRPDWNNRPRPPEQQFRPEPPRPEFRPQQPRPEFRPQPQAPRPEFRPQPQAPRPEFRPQPQAPRPQPQVQAPRPQPQPHIEAPRPEPQQNNSCSRKFCLN